MTKPNLQELKQTSIAILGMRTNGYAAMDLIELLKLQFSFDHRTAVRWFVRLISTNDLQRRA